MTVEKFIFFWKSFLNKKDNRESHSNVRHTTHISLYVIDFGHITIGFPIVIWLRNKNGFLFSKLYEKFHINRPISELHEYFLIISGLGWSPSHALEARQTIRGWKECQSLCNFVIFFFPAGFTIWWRDPRAGSRAMDTMTDHQTQSSYSTDLHLSERR